MDYLIPIAVALVFGVIGFSIGRSNGRSAGAVEGRGEADGRFRSLIDAVKRGRFPDILPGSAEGQLKAALEEGWAPREAEREAALHEAVGRVSAFLRTRVRGPLSGLGDQASPADLKDGIEHALGALEDLDFFISKMDETREGTDLAKLAQGVSREFASDQAVSVRLLLGGAMVRALVNPTALMDALYLILHNAGRFGGGTTIDLTVEDSGGRAAIRVRDRGKGFSEEAFARAFDPFYSTSDEGLGLGLPHVRKVIEQMGGRIVLRNVPDGGAEVEVSFPSA